MISQNRPIHVLFVKITTGIVSRPGQISLMDRNISGTNSAARLWNGTFENIPAFGISGFSDLLSEHHRLLFVDLDTQTDLLMVVTANLSFENLVTANLSFENLVTGVYTPPSDRSTGHHRDRMTNEKENFSLKSTGAAPNTRSAPRMNRGPSYRRSSHRWSPWVLSPPSTDHRNHAVIPRCQHRP